MDAQTREEIRQIEDRYLLLSEKRKAVQSEIDALTRERDAAVKELDTCARAIEFVEKVSTSERQAVKARVEELISSCLHTVFDDTYSVEFDYGLKRNKTSVEVYCVRRCGDGLRVRRQIDGIGGGVADAISLPLKLVVLLNDETLDRVLIIDEPGKHLSVEHVPRFAHFLQQVAKKLKVQIIMSSHHTCMDRYADSINAVSLTESVSAVERLK